jgi:4-amino-4-deoxy-L-arabinose transferase-like glycosyltransferase
MVRIMVDRARAAGASVPAWTGSVMPPGLLREDGVGAAPSRPSARRFLALLFAGGVAVNVATVLLTRRHATVATIDADEQEYWQLASALLDGRMDDLLMRRTLPFPAILAGLRLVLGSEYLRVQLAVSVLLALTPLLVHGFARRQLGSERAARIAALAVLFWPPFARYGATLYSDSLGLLAFAAFLFVAPLRGTAELGSAVGLRRWLVAGLLLGLCVHVKPLYLLYTPFAFVLALAAESSGALRLRAAALLTAGCLLVVLPWSAFISARQGRLLLISGNDGETLAGGLNARLLALEGTGKYVTPDKRTVWVGPGKWLDPPNTGYLTAEELGLPYAEQGQLLSRRAGEWIRSHPREVAYITARKLLYMWGVYPFWNGLAQSLLGNFLMLPLVLAAMLALRRLRGTGAALAPMWVLPIFCSLVACMSWGSWRFRMAGDLGLIVLAAGLVAHLLARHAAAGARQLPSPGR